MIIRLHWWKEFRTDSLQNYGDLMSKYLVKKISKKIVCTTRSNYNKWLKRIVEPYYIVIGSIIGGASKKAIVWGSGIIERNQEVNDATFLAVRGPLTRNRLLELGYDVPAVYGDPALLISRFIKNDEIKKYEIGIIPHFVDYQKVLDESPKDDRVKVINLLTNSVEKTTREILQCKSIISSSLHGVIVPQTYGIPALWVKLSDKLSGDNVKFYDYFESVDLNYENAIEINSKELSVEVMEGLLKSNYDKTLISEAKLKSVSENLLKSCPF